MLIVGLGNIGKEYENTRHNVGFFAVDTLADELNLKFDKKQCKSLLARRMKDNLILQKPTTYMNLSGLAVKEGLNLYKMTAEDLVVIYDDIDLPLGEVRYRTKGSAGTHNGMRNIIAEIGTTEFQRIRIGIGKPPNKEMELASFVLGKISKEEMVDMKVAVEEAVKRAIEIIEKA